MATEVRAAVERAARELLHLLAQLPAHAGGVRVTDAQGQTACLIQVWHTSEPMPTVKKRVTSERTECRADILDVIRTARRALLRKEVVRELKLAGKTHGPGTIAKALAELTRNGELVNPQDKRGYRLAEWRKKTPSLFD